MPRRRVNKQALKALDQEILRTVMVLQSYLLDRCRLDPIGTAEIYSVVLTDLVSRIQPEKEDEDNG